VVKDEEIDKKEIDHLQKNGYQTKNLLRRITETEKSKHAESGDIAHFETGKVGVKKDGTMEGV